MVPLNFLLFRIASRMVPKMGALTLYLFIFGLLSFATPLFGEGTGIIKVGLATAIGFTLDLLISSTKKLNTMLQILLFGGLGAFAWWLLTFSVWSLYGFPFVHAFANMLNSVIPLEGWISLPFADFSLDWFKFAAFCGFFSSIPVIIATVFGEKIAEQLQSTVVYQKFAELQNPETWTFYYLEAFSTHERTFGTRG